MKRLISVLLPIIVLCSLKGADTTGIVHGKVYDLSTSEPLISATVIYGKNEGVSTSSDGYYKIKTKPGNLNITFQYIGYQPMTRSLNLYAGDTIEFNAGLMRELREIDQVVVSAGKTEQKISDLTVSLSIIRPDIISRNHFTDAEELINRTPGIEILDGQASIRGGSGFSYGAGSRVLALIDGLPVVSADAGNIKWQYLPLENLSQIEIIKGASSVLYGSSALNGIINFRTADAKEEPSLSFFIESGIYDKPRQKKWIWWDSPRIFSSGSFSYLKKYGNTDVGISSGLFYTNGYRRLNDEKLARLSMSLKHFSKKVEGLTYGVRMNGGTTSKSDFIIWEDAEFGALKQDTSTATLLHGDFLTVDPFITFKSRSLNNHDLKIRIQSTRNLFPNGEQNDSKALSFYSEYQFRSRLYDFLSLNTGISENYSRIISSFFDDHTGLNFAGYAQLDFTPLKRLKAVAGLRIEQNYLDGKPDKPVPIFRTGINYQLADYTFLRASFGQGYRYPAVAEKFASTTLGAVKIFPSPDIQAESGWNSEIGIKQGIAVGKMNGLADISFFYLQNKDLIEFLFGLHIDPYTGISGLGFKAGNVEQSRVYGLEMEYSLNGSYGNADVMLGGGYIYMYPVEFNPLTGKNSNVFLKYRRKHSATLNIGVTRKKVQFGLSMYAKSKLLNIDDVFLEETTRELILKGFYDYWNNNNKAYFLVDPNLSYSLNENFRISLVIKNLTNTEYMGRPGDIMPQRNFSLRFSGMF